MVKNKKDFFEEFETPGVDVSEDKIPAEIKKAKSKVSLKDKPKITVIAIVKGWLWLKDEKENGYKIRITEEYKKYKVGDTL